MKPSNVYTTFTMEGINDPIDVRWYSATFNMEEGDAGRAYLEKKSRAEIFDIYRHQRG